MNQVKLETEYDYQQTNETHNHSMARARASFQCLKLFVSYNHIVTTTIEQEL